MTKEEAYSLTYGSKIWHVVKYGGPKTGSFSVTVDVGAVKEIDARNKLSITYPKEAHSTDWRWANRDIFHLEKCWFTSEQKAMEYKEKLLSEIFDWKTLTDGYTLFAGEYHADTHLNFKGEWSWYVWKGTEKIGSGKGLKDSSVSRAAAEKCILEHQKSANGGE